MTWHTAIERSLHSNGMTGVFMKVAGTGEHDTIAASSAPSAASDAPRADMMRQTLRKK
jgi:hypothetical protein